MRAGEHCPFSSTRDTMFSTPAYAQTGAAATGGLGSILGLMPLILVFVVFYFLMIRPQQRRMKALQQSVAAVKKGDQVVTAGGIVGRVTRVDEAQVEVEIAPNTRVRVIKATIAEVVNPSAKPAND
jgi:preprotein translocase subunit YajC